MAAASATLRVSEEEEEDVNPTISSLAPALISMSAGVWMVRAGLGKRMLAWRPLERPRRRR